MDEPGLTPTSDPHSPSGVYIPANLQGCFEELDRMLPASLLENIRTREEVDLIQQHFGLGMWIRNNWGLWASWSRLKEYFDSLGLFDADSASSFILASYWRYLNGRPIELSRLIVYDKIARDEIKNGPKAGNFS